MEGFRRAGHNYLTIGINISQYDGSFHLRPWLCLDLGDNHGQRHQTGRSGHFWLKNTCSYVMKIL